MWKWAKFPLHPKGNEMNGRKNNEEKGTEVEMGELHEYLKRRKERANATTFLD